MQTVDDEVFGMLRTSKNEIMCSIVLGEKVNGRHVEKNIFQNLRKLYTKLKILVRDGS